MSKVDEKKPQHQPRERFEEEPQANDGQTKMHAALQSSGVLDLNDLQALRLPQAEVDNASKEVVLTISMRKPAKHEFVRTHPDPAWRMDVRVVEVEEEGSFHKDLYVVHPAVAHLIPDDTKHMTLVTAVTRAGVYFLWPIPTTNRDNNWTATALRAVAAATTNWTRVISSQREKGYTTISAQIEIEEPTWPEEGFNSLLLKAFDSRVIRDDTHPVLLHLLGRA